MAKLIFLEGIATSGKTIVQEKLANELKSQGRKVLTVSEKAIINTFLEKGISSQNSCQKLKKVINRYLRFNYDYIIFDRCHFSNISFFGGAFDDFKEIDDLLYGVGSKVIILYYNEDQIISRIRNALKHRKGTGYLKYIKTMTKRAKSLQEENKMIFDYYKKSIDIRRKIVLRSKLDILKVNITKIVDKEDYYTIIPKIMRFV